MPRCNLTIKQKSQIIDLSNELTTEQLAKKFHVHPTTVTRTLKKKNKILDLASRINVNFKTVQTNMKNEEHDTMVLDYIKTKQSANEPITIKDICDKAGEFAKTLNREIKSRRGWWRRFKVRCNIVKSKVNSNTNKSSTGKKKLAANLTVPATPTTTTAKTKTAMTTASSNSSTPARRSKKQQQQQEKTNHAKGTDDADHQHDDDDGGDSSVIQKNNKDTQYTFKIREAYANNGAGLNLSSSNVKA